MPGPAVATARTGDVTAAASPATTATTLPDAAGGAWTAGAITLQAYAHLTVAGNAVIWQASCTFTYAGTSSSSGSPVGTSSSVTVTAPPTVLQRGATNVLRAGDTASDADGNRLMVTPSGHLTSA